MPRPKGSKDKKPRRLGAGSRKVLERVNTPMPDGQKSVALRIRGHSKAVEWFEGRLDYAQRGEYVAWLYQNRDRIELE